MGELFALIVSVLDLPALWDSRQRRRRLAGLARGQRVRLYGVLRDPQLTDGRQREGWLRLGDGRPVTWTAKGETYSTLFSPGPLTMSAVDRRSITFQSGRTELRMHPDEAPHLLRALEASGR